MPLILAVFLAVYVGMALGRWPGLRIDRTGIAILGAVVLYAAGAVDGAQVLHAIDFPTLIVLFGLMMLSAQYAACGFYDWCSARIAAARTSPAAILGLTVLVAGVLSAVLANDVVVFAMTPMLIAGLLRRGLDPRPYLIALAGASNAGSAATVIGNPQNILIGQLGGLDFWAFLGACGPPAVFGLLMVFAVVRVVWRRQLGSAADRRAEIEIPPIDRLGTGKAALATVALLAMFTTPLPHVTGVLIVAAVLLVSRRLATREILGLVDWQLLVLFAGPVRGHGRVRRGRPRRPHACRADGRRHRSARPAGAGGADACRQQHDRQRADGRAAARRPARTCLPSPSTRWRPCRRSPATC